MALRPPSDFSPPVPPPPAPSEDDLRALWQRQEAVRRERERSAHWRQALEELRRNGEGKLQTAAAMGDLPASLREAAFGPDARAALRPVPAEGRVRAVGVDTWSPCWYAQPGSLLARAMEALAREPTRRAWLLPEPILGHRVGWFPEPRLVFAEGRADAERLLAAAELPAALDRLRHAFLDLGTPLAPAPCAGLRRLDVTADIWTDGGAEGLALLEALAAATAGAAKLCAYRGERRT